MRYIAILVVIWLVISFIYSKVKKFLKKPKSDNLTLHNDTKTHIAFKEEYLEQRLDSIMNFLNAYSAVVPDEMYCLFISQKQQYNQSADSDRVDGYLKFEIIVGCWWDSLLYKHPGIDDYMKSTFMFDSEKRSFVCTNLRTGSSTCCPFPSDKVNALLQKYLDNYEVKHPEINFERHSWGACLQKKV